MRLTEVIAIDPGQSGAIVWYNGDEFLLFKMPLKDKVEKEIDFYAVRKILKMYPGVHVFLERAAPHAMGSKHAFNYGRGFAALEIAIMTSKNPVTYIEPSKWCKVMHAGISSDLKPKIKSNKAIERLLPKIAKKIPKNKNGKMHDGFVDAILIAEYGRRTL
jgi:hypothetical protein